MKPWTVTVSVSSHRPHRPRSSIEVCEADAMIEKTTVSRSEPSPMMLWLRRTPSCFAPKRAIAARD